MDEAVRSRCGQLQNINNFPIFRGPDYDTKLNGVDGVTVRILIEEIYLKACESRDWTWVRLTAGLLGRQLDELSKAVTHLLVRQKQLTVGMPSKNEEPITCPKTREELREIFKRCYGNDPSSFILAQEIIVSLGSLVSWADEWALYCGQK